MRDSIRTIHGLLPHSNLHPVRPDRHHLLGELLAEPERHPCPSGARGNHRLDHDHAHVLDERGATQDLIRQEY